MLRGATVVDLKDGGDGLVENRPSFIEIKSLKNLTNTIGIEKNFPKFASLLD